MLLGRYLSAISHRYRFSLVRMSTFVAVKNPLTGKRDWIMQDDNYDYHQEIARSAYADMLHDTERNHKYYVALEKAIHIMRKRNKPVHVLDIGTGTSLLSMMAARLGADQITACEAFKPMANCALKVMEQNGYGDKINLIQKRSTDITVGKDGDMRSRANILITEVFDTELIGEGAIGTFTHAHQHLLEEDCIVVPSAANMYVQPVSSSFVRRWRDLQPQQLPNGQSVVVPSDITHCSGAPSLHDLQLDQLSEEQFNAVCSPVKAFRFDFTGKTGLPFDEEVEHSVTSAVSGNVDAIFVWWDLEMDTQGEIILSCAPRWAHPNIQELQWRDHWMQAIYYPSVPLSITKGDQVKVICCHDEYSLWFDVSKLEDCNEEKSKHTGPTCTCGAHICFSRGRLGMMNDPRRQISYREALQKGHVYLRDWQLQPVLNVYGVYTELDTWNGRYVTNASQVIHKNSICLCLGDGNMMAVMAAKLGAKKVYTVESCEMIRRQMSKIIAHNNVDDVVRVLDKDAENVNEDDLDGNKIDIVLSEPFFQSAVLPWQHIYTWYATQNLSASSLLSKDCQVLPGVMKVKAVAVEFKDLWKIRSRVGTCEGFDLKAFDDLIMSSSDRCDAVIEPHPLWEYPCRSLSTIETIFSADQSTWDQQNITRKISLHLKGAGRCHGVVLWADYTLTDDHVISTGPRSEVKLGEYIQWDFYSKQGIHLLHDPVELTNDSTDTSHVIHVDFSFRPKEGDISFLFTVEQ